jgi:aspartate dehydrogenase
MVVFEGPASTAVKLFPKNVNVAASLSLAGIGFEKTQVRIIVDPESDINEHHLEATGEFGKLDVTVQNVQCPDNPKTSYLAALSAISTLKYICEPIKVGS